MDKNKPIPEPQRAEGPTPAGGAYSILYTKDDGSLEIVEFDDEDREIQRTYFNAPANSAQ